MKQLHAIQLDILKKLTFSEWLRYSDFKSSDNMPSSQVYFHLESLQKQWFVVKEGDRYVLTLEWKEYANKIDKIDGMVHKQAFLSVLVVCSRENEDGSNSYLVYTRKKHPFFWTQWLLSGKVFWWETIEKAAKRSLESKVGLSWDVHLVWTLHYHDYDKASQELIDDKIIFLCHVANPVGELFWTEQWHGEWVSENELSWYIKIPFRTVEDTIRLMMLAKKEERDYIEERVWYIDSY